MMAHLQDDLRQTKMDLERAKNNVLKEKSALATAVKMLCAGAVLILVAAVAGWVGPLRGAGAGFNKFCWWLRLVGVVIIAVAGGAAVHRQGALAEESRQQVCVRSISLPESRAGRPY